MKGSPANNAIHTELISDQCTQIDRPRDRDAQTLERIETDRPPYDRQNDEALYNIVMIMIMIISVIL